MSMQAKFLSMPDGTQLACNDMSSCAMECRAQPIPSQQSCISAVSAYFAPIPVCFGPESWVFVKGKGRTKIAQLEIGDKVLDENLHGTEVVAWLHKDDERTAEFLSFNVGGFDPFVVSSDHFVFDPSKGTYVIAGEASALQIASFDANLYRYDIRKDCPPSVVTVKGVYAPLTASGTILVQNVVASCFAAPFGISKVLSHSAINAAMLGVRKGIIPWNFHVIEEYMEMICEIAEFAE